MAICTLINSWGKEVITTLRKRFAEAQSLCSKRMFAQHKEKKREKHHNIFPFLATNAEINIFTKVVFSPWTKPSCRCFGGQVNGTAWPFPPTAACLGMHRRPWWLMSGQGEQKSIPRLQCGPGDGWPLRGLCRADGSRAQESQKPRHGTCCRAWRMATQRKDARVRGKSKKWILYCECNSAFFSSVKKLYKFFFPPALLWTLSSLLQFQL